MSTTLDGCFVLIAFLQLPLYFLLADRDSKRFNKHGGKALGLITFELTCSISAEPYIVANQISPPPERIEALPPATENSVTVQELAPSDSGLPSSV